MPGSAGSIRAGRAYYEIGGENNPLVKILKASENLIKGSAASAAKTFTSALSKIGGGIKDTLTSPLTALAAILGPAAASKLFAGMGSELEDVARRTGASTDALGRFDYAAKRTGSSLGAIEGALTHVRDKIVDAARGSDDAQIAFARLGFSFNTLARMKPEDRLREIARRLNMIPDPALRAAAAQEALGSADLLPTIARLDELEKRSQRLGLTLSTSDTAAAKKFGEALEDLHQNLLMTASTIGVKIAPAATELIGRWVEMSGHTREWIRNNTEAFSSADALWAFLKLQWAKGSDLLGKYWGVTTRTMKDLWIDASTEIAKGWTTVAFVAEHTLGSLGKLGKTIFEGLRDAAVTSLQAIAKAIGGIAPAAATAMEAAIQSIKALELGELGKGIKQLAIEFTGLDSPELKQKLDQLEAARAASHAANHAGEAKDNADRIAQLEQEYQNALAAAKARKSKDEEPGKAKGPNGKPGAEKPGAGIDAAIMHVQGIGAVDLKTKEGFQAAAASLRQAQTLQKQFDLQSRQFIEERRMRIALEKLNVRNF